MIFKKIFVFVLLFSVLFQTVCLADDYIEDVTNEINIYVSSNIVNIPLINSKHCAILDRNSKTLLYGKNENDKCKMASTTKIMTAITVIENCNNLNATVTISKKAANTGGSRLGLSTNDTITVNNLLYGLMMVSGNDAAVALAEFISGNIENFSDLMNKKAKDLGLNSTHFVTPHGLDQDEHYTTTYELAVITDYALKNKTFCKIVNTKSYTITINTSPKNLNNTNELLGYLDGVYGVKTGFTNGANRCLVTACKRSNLDIICVVLGADTKKNRTLDSINLINYIFANFTVVNIKDIVYKEFENWNYKNNSLFNINKSISSKLDLFIDDSSLPYENIAIQNNKVDKLYTKINCSKNLSAPIYENTLIGTIDVNLENKKLFEISIKNKNYVFKKNIKYYLMYFFKQYFTIIKNTPF